MKQSRSIRSYVRNVIRIVHNVSNLMKDMAVGLSQGGGYRNF
ncbi:hypothetical protein HS7_05730 [Sulfolobales archaeon HS-7]|nr:hypothetical protein HS7_05730 [Sulfolobales archaeon HS-7]